ncbi:GNAT family N-acetyltransferase [Variovorax sp. LARHSF232]
MGTGQDRTAAHAVPLRDSRSVTVRAVRPEDKDEFETAFERLSPSARYSRFFAPLRELPPDMLSAAVDPPVGQVVALVALAGSSDPAGGERIVAGARFAHAPDSKVCEFAVTVADDWQGLGLARHMMEELIALAREHGLQRIEGIVLPDNTGMRGLAARLGFTDTAWPEDRSLRLVSLTLD